MMVRALMVFVGSTLLVGAAAAAPKHLVCKGAEGHAAFTREVRIDDAKRSVAILLSPDTWWPATRVDRLTATTIAAGWASDQYQRYTLQKADGSVGVYEAVREMNLVISRVTGELSESVHTRFRGAVPTPSELPRLVPDPGSDSPYDPASLLQSSEVKAHCELARPKF